MAKKKRRGHFCRICKRYRPNERFSGKGHATHVCKECSRLPKAERFRIESTDGLWDYLFRESHISAKNIAHLAQLAEAEDQMVSRFAAVVLELAHLRPYRRRRFRGLRRSHPELWQRLIEFNIVEDFPIEEEWEPSEEELARFEEESTRPSEPRDLAGEDYDIPF